MFMDSVLYLPDDILVKVDRASMGVSLEARVPLLDHRVYEFAWSLPLAGVRGQAEGCAGPDRHVPPALIDRPKMGFGVPLERGCAGRCATGPATFLSTGALESGGEFAAAPITALLDDHLSGREDFQAPLWNVLAFESWRRAQRDGRAGA